MRERYKRFTDQTILPDSKEELKEYIRQQVADGRAVFQPGLGRCEICHKNFAQVIHKGKKICQLCKYPCLNVPWRWRNKRKKRKKR